MPRPLKTTRLDWRRSIQAFGQRLRLFALEPHDLALTKLERNFERDRADVAHLAAAGHLKAQILRERYYKELRPYVIGRESWHDQTLELWLEAYFPRGARSFMMTSVKHSTLEHARCARA